MNITKALDEHMAVMQELYPLVPKIRELANQMVAAVKKGGKIFWMGNGGSAADAQHLAAELIGRFCRERPAIASIALSTDTSILTSIANDYEYARVFARQLEALCLPNDVVVGISTSGNSPNVLAGIEVARSKGAMTVGFAGQTGGLLAAQVDCSIQIPSTNTARIQEAHILIGHILCDCIERQLAGEVCE
jgi:D-sedoheptulose 7-phosphate isomerase